MAAALIDTNILVYAHDHADPAKAERAIKTLDHMQSTQSGRLSAQILAEFFVVVIRGRGPLLSVRRAIRQIDLLSRAFQVLDITQMIVLEATRGVRAQQFSYWDSQIWASARLHQIPVVLTEDFQDGASIEGERFVNPFASTVPVAELV